MRAGALLLLFLLGSCAGDDAMKPVPVEILATESGYQLLRGGEPYTIRGAGMVHDDIARFAARGGNSIRNWTTNDAEQNIAELLDSALEHGVSVALCLPMTAERHGFDYDDDEAVARQLAAFRAIVATYRSHPALLVWIIGNELNHEYQNPRVYDAVNDVAEMIAELDPWHPSTTTVAGFRPDVIAEIEARAPALDFISFQLYGGLFALPEQLEASGYDRPFMITEWGPLGHWEMEKTAWGAPIELTSSEKADVIARGYREIIAPLDAQILGNYVFFWGQKQERTPTWFGLLTESGQETEVVDVMQHVWTGAWPANRTPAVRALLIDGRGATGDVTLEPSEDYPVLFQVSDPEGSAIRYRYEVKAESDATQTGGDYEAPIASLEGVLAATGDGRATLTAPAPGAYRLFAYAEDAAGRVAHANVPFQVSGASAQ